MSNLSHLRNYLENLANLGIDWLMIQEQTQSESLADLLRNSSRKKEHRKIGIEIERIGIWPNCTPFRYEQSTTGNQRQGAKQLLNELSEKYHWTKVNNANGDPVGLNLDSGTGKITLEPGSQLELATEASVELGSLVERTNRFEEKVDAVTQPWDLNWIGLGVNPCNTVVEIDVIPSERYGIMTEYIQNQGQLATTMMRLSSSVQINLDYRCEEEGIEMLQVALAAAPVSYALFANSPLFRGKQTQYLSYRRAIWARTDPDRTGLLPEAFAPDFNFSSYAQHLWKMPLMFALNKKEEYIPSNGCSLKDIAEGKLPGAEADENNQGSAIRQLFTEARIKPGYVEVRSVDGLAPKQRYAAAAFWMGILYDKDARDFVLKELGGLSPEMRELLTEQAALKALNAKVEGFELKQLARDLVAASRKGLAARGYGEEAYLAPVEETVETGLSPAEQVMEKFNSVEKGKIKTVIAFVGGKSSA